MSKQLKSLSIPTQDEQQDKLQDKHIFDIFFFEIRNRVWNTTWGAVLLSALAVAFEIVVGL